MRGCTCWHKFKSTDCWSISTDAAKEAPEQEEVSDEPQSQTLRQWWFPPRSTPGYVHDWCGSTRSTCATPLSHSLLDLETNNNNYFVYYLLSPWLNGPKRGNFFRGFYCIGHISKNTQRLATKTSDLVDSYAWGWILKSRSQSAIK